MKSIKYYLPLLAVLLISTINFTSCQKAPINGNLDGQWEVMEVNPEPQRVVDNRLFYNFYLHVCQLTFYGDFFLDGNIRYNDKTLWIEFPYELDEYQISVLKQYGIEENPITFEVDFPSKNKMVLTTAYNQITLRKF